MKDLIYAPICLFVYNRLDLVKLTVEALENNFLARQSDLHIFSDGYGDDLEKEKITEVRSYLKEINGFKTVTIYESDKNKGLANSIIDGATQILKKYGKAIVLEDDLISSPGFLNFMNQALFYYENDMTIQSIAGFSFPLKQSTQNVDCYFQKRPTSWGWATWSNRWDKQIFDKKQLLTELSSDITLLELFQKSLGNDLGKMLTDSLAGKNDSWYVRWSYNHFKNDCYTVYPKYSLIRNIGFGDLATHCSGVNAYDYKLDTRNKENYKLVPFRKPQNATTKEFLYYFTKKYKLLLRLNLLKTNVGREQLIIEIKQRFLQLI